MLQEDPDDEFLHYAVGKELLASGDVEGGRAKLQAVIARFPDYVAAYFQLGQSLSESGQAESARTVIEQGIETAQRVGDQHAEMEMRGFLDLL